MMMATTDTENLTPKQLARNAVESNLTIQNVLSERATQLGAQIQQLDELVEAVQKGVSTEDVTSDDLGCEVQIPGSKRINGLIPSFELLSPSSPFYKEASERAHYVRWTTVHPFKGKEAEALAEGVKKENLRLEAYRARNNSSAPPIDLQHNIEGVNWSIVAEKVSDNSPIKRTPDECRIYWIGNLHPKVNHADWTEEELSRLHELTAAASGTGENINWVRIAKELGTNRVPIECMKRAVARPRLHWDPLADQRLLEAVLTFGTDNWNLVARHVSPYATTSQCQSRYVRSLDPGIKRGQWTSEEDTRLRKAVEAFGNSWVDVAAVLIGRTNEQCRERWSEISVSTSGKGQWSEEEDKKLVDAVKELGNKWKMISMRVGGGRTGPNCRLRYDRILKSRANQSETNPAPNSTLEAFATPPEVDISAEASTEISSEPILRRPKRGATRKSRVATGTKNSGTISARKSNALATGESSAIDSQSAPAADAKPLPQRARPQLRPVARGKGKERAIGSVQLEASSEPTLPPVTSGLLSVPVGLGSNCGAVQGTTESVGLMGPTHETRQVSPEAQGTSAESRKQSGAKRRGKRKRHQDVDI